MNVRRRRTLAGAVAVLLGLAGVRGYAQPTPKNPEPFDVFVFTDAPDDTTDKDSLTKTTEEVAKKIRDRKKWFRLVERREDADIVVEVLDQASSQDVSNNFTRRADNAEPSDPQMTNFLDVAEGFTLQTRVHVPKAEPIAMDVTTEGRRPRDTAKPFATRLETFCRLNYWMLKKALEP